MLLPNWRRWSVAGHWDCHNWRNNNYHICRSRKNNKLMHSMLSEDTQPKFRVLKQHYRVLTHFIRLLFIYRCCSYFFISGNIYFSFVSTSLAYITILKNKGKLPEIKNQLQQKNKYNFPQLFPWPFKVCHDLGFNCQFWKFSKLFLF